MRFKALLVFLLLTGRPLLASEPKTWNLSTQQEFLRGKLQGVSLTADGRLMPAPAFEIKGDTSQAYIFSMTQDRQGNVYAGTGNDGKIFRLGRDGKLSELAALKEIAIYALATGSDSTLYAGSSPDGKVYAISPEGEVRTFFDPKEKYIWALSFDPQGNLFVATGPRGVIFKVAPSGEGNPFYDSPETHITTMTMDGADLLAGSAPGGYIYRIDPKAKPFVLYDSTLSEIRSLAVDRTGLIYATAFAASEAPPAEPDESARAASSPVRTLPGVARAAAADAEVTVVQSGGARVDGKKSEVYRISKDGTIESLVASDEDLFYSLLVRNDGTVLLGSGRRGRIFSVDRNRGAAVLLQAPEEQVTVLLEQGSRILAATSNLGKVYELTPTPSAAAWYESDVLDGRFTSRWGMLSWKVENASATTAELYTRSGNTSVPDLTWSDWAGPYRESSGEAIQSPPARFLQWKVQFPPGSRQAAVVSTSNAVRSVSATYLQQNIAPQITSVNLLSPGVALQQFASAPPPGAVLPGRSQARSGSPTARFARDIDSQSARAAPRRVYIPGAQSLTWEARDDNGDEMDYSLYFRGEGESSWKLLDEHLSDNNYTFDSRALAEGSYAIKVVASDLPSNPRDKALTDEFVSKTFTVTSAPPAIRLQTVRGIDNRIDIRFSVASKTAPLFQAEVSIDGDDWEIVYPVDGITDGLSEEYSYTAPAPAGEHTVGLRVTDTVGNVATTKAVVRF